MRAHIAAPCADDNLARAKPVGMGAGGGRCDETGIAQLALHRVRHRPAKRERRHGLVRMDQHRIVILRNQIIGQLRLGGFGWRREDIAYRCADQRARGQGICGVKQGQELCLEGAAPKGEQFGDQQIGGAGLDVGDQHLAPRCLQRFRGKRAVFIQQPREIHTVRAQRRQLHHVNAVAVQLRCGHPARDDLHIMPRRPIGATKGQGAGQMAGAQQMRDDDADLHKRGSSRMGSGWAVQPLGEISSRYKRLRLI